MGWFTDAFRRVECGGTATTWVRYNRSSTLVHACSLPVAYRYNKPMHRDHNFTASQL